MLAHAVRARCDGLIDMDARGGLPGARATDVGRALDAPAHRVVEDDDAVRLQRRPDEGFHRGIVGPLDLGLVMEVSDRGRMPDQGKALAIQREVA